MESSHAKYHGSENSNEDNGLKDYVTTPLRKSKFNVEVTRLNKTLTPVAKQQKDDAITQFSHSGLCSKSKAICHAFSKQFKIKINSEFDESCNVLVLVKKAETNEYSKTVKAAAAIMRGGLLVDLKWAEESLKKGQIFSYQEYLIDSFADYQVSAIKCYNKNPFEHIVPLYASGMGTVNWKPFREIIVQTENKSMMP